MSHFPNGTKRPRGLHLDVTVDPAADTERLSQGHATVFLADVVDERRKNGRASYIRRPEAAHRILTADPLHNLEWGDGHDDLAVALVHREPAVLGRITISAMPPILVPWRLVDGKPHLAARVTASGAVVHVPAEVGPPFGPQTWPMFDQPMDEGPIWRPITDPAN